MLRNLWPQIVLLVVLLVVSAANILVGTYFQSEGRKRNAEAQATYRDATTKYQDAGATYEKAKKLTDDANKKMREVMRDCGR